MKQTEQPELNRPIIQQRTTYLPARLPCSVAPAWRVGVTSRSANATRGCETRTTWTGRPSPAGPPTRQWARAPPPWLLAAARAGPHGRSTYPAGSCSRAGPQPPWPGAKAAWKCRPPASPYGQEGRRAAWRRGAPNLRAGVWPGVDGLLGEGYRHGCPPLAGLGWDDL